MGETTDQKDYNEMSVYDVWRVIVKYKIMIVVIFLVSVISTAAISLSMPKVYRAEVAYEIRIPNIGTNKLTAQEILILLGKEDEQLKKIIFP